VQDATLILQCADEHQATLAPLLNPAILAR
jgi:hypothetical protein